MARKELTIGIAIRNEERAITLFMNSLVQAAKSLSHAIVCETIVCVNGSSDNSLKILLEMQQNTKRFLQRATTNGVREYPNEFAFS